MPSSEDGLFKNFANGLGKRVKAYAEGRCADSFKWVYGSSDLVPLVV